MRECGCKWDGNLDGKLIRCKRHRELYLFEKQLRKEMEEEIDRRIRAFRTEGR